MQSAVQSAEQQSVQNSVVRSGKTANKQSYPNSRLQVQRSGRCTAREVYDRPNACTGGGVKGPSHCTPPLRPTQSLGLRQHLFGQFHRVTRWRVRFLHAVESGDKRHCLRAGSKVKDDAYLCALTIFRCACGRRMAALLKGLRNVVMKKKRGDAAGAAAAAAARVHDSDDDNGDAADAADAEKDGNCTRLRSRSSQLALLLCCVCVCHAFAR